MSDPLRVGYIMQTGVPDLHVASGPTLHVTAVVQGLRGAGHAVRTLRLHGASVEATDDLREWATVPYGFSRSAAFRALERPIRRVQFELGLPFANLFDSVRYADAAARALRGSDVLYERHGYLAYGSVLTASRLGIPLVVELNGNILRELDEMHVPLTPAQRRLGRWITRRTLRAADHVVVVSDALRHEVVDGLRVPPANVSTIVNGVDFTLFAAASADSGIRQELGLGGGPLVTFVGHFQPWHGVDLLVDAFARVQAARADARLVLVGDGTGREAIAARLASAPYRGSVVLTGRLPQADVARVVSTSDVLVAPYPYRSDDIVGTPLKLMEYMAAGKAIVASRARIHEFAQDGVTALRVEPADAGALAEGILRILDDPDLARRLGQAARKQAQGYSWDAVVERLVVLFRGLIARRRR